MSNSTSLKNAEKTYNSIVHSSFNVGSGIRDYSNIAKRTEETVDIVSEYPWTVDIISKSKDGGIINVPHCYAIEYQQRYTSSITNLLNSVTALSGGVSDTTNVVGKMCNKISNLV